jgi:hypothetical protein
MFEAYDNNFKFKLLMAIEKETYHYLIKDSVIIIVLLPYAIKRRPLYIWREKM